MSRARAGRLMPGFLLTAITRIESSPTGSRLARGAFWSLNGTIVARGLTIITSIILARLLGKEGFGELAIIQNTVGTFGVISGFGLGITATRYVAEYKGTNSQKAGEIIGLSMMFALVTGGIGTLIILVTARWIAGYWLVAPHLGNVLRIGAFLILINALSGATTGALSGLESFRSIAKINLLSGVISVQLILAGAYWGNLDGIIWGLIASSLIGWLLSYKALKDDIADYGIVISVKNCIKEWKILTSFSLPAALASIMAWPVNWLCASMLVNQANGYKEMGVFSVAEQWFLALLFLPNVIGQAMLPVMSEQVSSGKMKEVSNLLKSSIKINATIAVVFLGAICLVSPWVMRLYGAEFTESWPVLIVSLSTAGVLVVQVPVGQVIAATSKMWLGFVMNLGWAASYITLTKIWIGHGAIGLTSARGVAYMIHAVWTFVFAYRLVVRQRTSDLSLAVN